MNLNKICQCDHDFRCRSSAVHILPGGTNFLNLEWYFFYMWCFLTLVSCFFCVLFWCGVLSNLGVLLFFGVDGEPLHDNNFFLNFANLFETNMVLTPVDRP